MIIYLRHSFLLVRFYAFQYPMAASTMLLEILFASLSFILEAIAEKADFYSVASKITHFLAETSRYIDLTDLMELSHHPLGHLCWISFLDL